MKIKASSFTDFPQKGAIRIEVNKIELDLIDSIFISCNNEQSGGAIQVAITEGNCKFNRDCGTDCYTTVSGNANDFGQFLFVSCSKGQIEYENIVASFCPTQMMTKVHNGALSFIGKAELKCSHTNSSNNHGYFGPGFAAHQTTNVALSYMNFANNTAHITTRKEYWIAVVFHDNASGSVSMSNFDCCKSQIDEGTQPYGTFSLCIFYRCENYFISKLPSGNTNESPSNFAFPMKCDARITENSDPINNYGRRAFSILELVLFSSSKVQLLS